MSYNKIEDEEKNNIKSKILYTNKYNRIEMLNCYKKINNKNYTYFYRELSRKLKFKKLFSTFIVILGFTKLLKKL